VIAIYIGSRANYSSALPIIRAINASGKLDLKIVLGGAGVLSRAGELAPIMKRDGIKADEVVNTIIEGDGLDVMAQSTGLGMQMFPSILARLAPDAVIAIGDRFDVLPWVISASFMNIPVAHTMGGELSGTIDERIRHAITKLSDYHFAANAESAARIIKMGEDSSRVFNVGCPRIDYVKECVDRFNAGNRYSVEELFDLYKGVGPRLKLKDGEFLLVSFHPVTTEYGEAGAQMCSILDALNALKFETVLLWPNIDAGNEAVSKSIRVLREKERPDWLHVFKNLPPNVYTELMCRCGCLVGNSSSAVREGEYIGTPSVNIGTRQMMRERGGNIIDVVVSESEQIKKAILSQMQRERIVSKHLYGQGNSGARIAHKLESLDKLSTKTFNSY
jgi:UDP-hydrolysing UDP-N-acetyl-D-glucosamine 2-epimerase